MNLAELKKIAELALAGGINDEIAIQRYEVFEEYVSPALILRMIANYEKAVEALKYNVSKHNEWIDKGHWCDSKRVLQSIVDSSKQTLKDLGEI